MSRTSIISTCSSSKTPSPTSSATDIPYPRGPRRSRRGWLESRPGTRPVLWERGASVDSRLAGVIHVIAGRLPEPHPREPAPGDARGEPLPAEDRDVLRRGNPVPEPGNIEVEILVVQLRGDRLVHQPFQDAHVEDITRLRVDLPLDFHLELVIVAVEVRVVAGAERLPIPRLRAGRVVQPVRGVEVDSAGHDAARHTRGLRGTQYEGADPAHRGRRPGAET